MHLAFSIVDTAYLSTVDHASQRSANRVSLNVPDLYSGRRYNRLAGRQAIVLSPLLLSVAIQPVLPAPRLRPGAASTCYYPELATHGFNKEHSKYCARNLLVVLRHSAPLYGLNIRPDGFVKVEDLSTIPNFSRLTIELLKPLVEQLEDELELIKEEEAGPHANGGWYIRARQGHSIQNVNILVECDDEALDALKTNTVVYRATVTKWKRIRATGAVRPRNGQTYIELDVKTVASPPTRCVVLEMDVERALSAGLRYLRGNDGRIYTPGGSGASIPLSFFPVVEECTGDGDTSKPREKSVKRHSRSKHPQVVLSNCDRRERHKARVANERNLQKWISAFASQPGLYLKALGSAQIDSTPSSVLVSMSSHSPPQLYPNNIDEVSDTGISAFGACQDFGDHDAAVFGQSLRPAESVLFAADSIHHQSREFTLGAVSQYPTQSDLAGIWSRGASKRADDIALADDVFSNAGTEETEDIIIITSTSPPERLSSHAQIFVPANGAVRVTDHTTPPLVAPLPLTSMSKPAQYSTVDPARWIILPVSIPGCGKTGICAALAHLFGFAHVQAGDVPVQRVKYRPGQGQAFLDTVLAAFSTSNVVLADRNNHLRMHRTALRNAYSSLDSKAHPSTSQEPKILALTWSLHRPSRRAVHNCCANRILAWRHAQRWFIPRATETLRGILWKFLDSADPLGPDEADAIIDMDPFEKIEDALPRVVRHVARLLGLADPPDERMKDAIQVARKYRSNIRV